MGFQAHVAVLHVARTVQPTTWASSPDSVGPSAPPWWTQGGRGDRWATLKTLVGWRFWEFHRESRHQTVGIQADTTDKRWLLDDYMELIGHCRGFWLEFIANNMWYDIVTQRHQTWLGFPSALWAFKWDNHRTTCFFFSAPCLISGE